MIVTPDENIAIEFAAWILKNGFQPSHEHPHKWMKFDTVGLKAKHYSETQMFKMYKKACEKAEKPCECDYEPDTCMGKEIYVCKHCGDVI